MEGKPSICLTFKALDFKGSPSSMEGKASICLTFKALDLPNLQSFGLAQPSIFETWP
ncbi:hypothetical protein ES703_47083 [subsurface metagenome]